MTANPRIELKVVPKPGPSGGENPRIHRHTGDCIHSDRVQGVNLALLTDPAGHDQLPFRNLPQALRHLEGKALHGPFPIDMGIKKRATIRLQLRNSLVSSKRHLVLPALYRHTPL